MTADAAPPREQRASFLWLYAIAWAGGAVAYVPFLTILLPVRLAAMTGADKVTWLAYTTFWGAVAASLGGILFGWLSDKTGVRRAWIVAGLVLSIVLLLSVAAVDRPLPLLLLIVAWQLALNMMLAPLAAWAADHVPVSQLGTLGGLLAFSPALGSIAGALVTVSGLASPDGRLVVVAALVAACVLPALIFADPREAVPREDPAPSAVPRSDRRMVIGMWLGRLLVQISEAALFAYLYYYFRSIDPARDEGSIARLFGFVLTIAVPVALVAGRWADRSRRPMLPLVGTSALSACGLAAMAFAHTPTAAVAGYVLFGLSTTVFLSLHSGQTLRVLPRPSRRGRDLGLFNLTNTVPSLIMPWLTIAIVPGFGFAGLFLLLALLAAIASALLALLPKTQPVP